jgi:acyl-CoA synthetase (AMP-forming)/AMP-acid ligase II
MGLIDDVTTLADLPRIVSRVCPDKPALIVEDRSLGFGDLESLTNRIANALLREGVAAGDRVALLGRESLDSLALLLGIAKANGVCVGLNWRLAADELAYIIADSGARLFFVDRESWPLASRILAQIESPPKVVVIGDGATAPDQLSFARFCEDVTDSDPCLQHDPEDAVAQIYTSGTTGHPKGVQVPNRSFFAIAREMHRIGDRWIGWTEEDVSLVCIPTFHIGGLWWLIRSLALGNTTVVLRSFDPGGVLDAIARYRVSRTCMVPAMLQVTLGEPGCESTDFSSLRTVVHGGSPISAALLRRCQQVFRCDFAQIYGLTETGNMAVCMRPEDHRSPDEQKLRAAGRPLPGVKVRILDPDGDEAPVGVVGEIAIHSPARMLGYWKLPEPTARTLIDGWVITGDAGYKDEEGFVYICDRIKDMIIVAGENVYPAEIENVLRGHRDVADVAVIGVPDEFWGEAVKAVVVRRAGASPSAAEIIRHTRGRLAEFKIPKTVDFVEQLPRNASGKLLKKQLREPYWEGRQRRIN